MQTKKTRKIKFLHGMDRYYKILIENDVVVAAKMCVTVCCSFRFKTHWVK